MTDSPRPPALLDTVPDNPFESGAAGGRGARIRAFGATISLSPIVARAASKSAHQLVDTWVLIVSHQVSPKQMSDYCFAGMKNQAVPAVPVTGLRLKVSDTQTLWGVELMDA